MSWTDVVIAVAACVQAVLAIALVVVTIALVVVTSRQVRLTHMYVELTRGILAASDGAWKDGKMPVLVFRALDTRKMAGDEPYEADRVVNLGAGPALGVQIVSSARFNAGRVVEKGQPLDGSFFKYDKVIGVDECGVNFFETGGGSVLKEDGVDFVVTYKDVFGRGFRTTYRDGRNVVERVGG